MDKKFNRREAIKKISIVVGSTATVIALPSKWTKPVMDAVIGPAGAAFISFCRPDGTYVGDGGRVVIANADRCPQPTTTSS